MNALPPAILLDPQPDQVADLAAHGVPLVVCASERNHPAFASRFVERNEVTPPRWTDEFRAWFVTLETRFPGAVVMTASDVDLWWLDQYRANHPASTLRIAVPLSHALRVTTVKSALAVLCERHGVPTPPTWLADEKGVAEAMVEATFPVTLKPQTRIGRLHWSQGWFVRTPDALESAVERARRAFSYRDEVRATWPEAATPLIQEFVGGQDRPIYHLAGYLSASGDSAVLAHRKLLQFPRRFGSGVCFETAAVDTVLAGRLMEMLRSVAFNGMFEAEFVERGEERLLIDLNARPYNGMLLETRRCLSLPWYLYLGAIGASERLAEELQAAPDLGDGPALFVCRKLEFACTMAGQLACGGMSLRQTGRWLKWYWERRKAMFDPFEIEGDRAVGRARLRRQLGRWLHRPREFLGIDCRREPGGV